MDRPRPVFGPLAKIVDVWSLVAVVAGPETPIRCSWTSSRRWEIPYPDRAEATP